VGIALHDPYQKTGGLAHVMLPSSQGHTGPPGKFMDTAIPELLNQLSRMGSKVAAMTARIAGGASMLNASAGTSIGDQNVAAAETELSRLRIPIVGRHCGGTSGRRMLFCTQTGSVRIEVVGAGDAEI